MRTGVNQGNMNSFKSLHRVVTVKSINMRLCKLDTDSKVEVAMSQKIGEYFVAVFSIAALCLLCFGITYLIYFVRLSI